MDQYRPTIANITLNDMTIVELITINNKAAIPAKNTKPIANITTLTTNESILWDKITCQDPADWLPAF